MKTAIIGGGASGYAAALTAAKRGDAVTILERGSKPLRKLLASGNGRGNLLNRGDLRYHGDEALIHTVFTRVPPRAVEEFWLSLGVPLAQEDDHRVYPAARLAQVACDALLLAADRAPIRLLCNREALSLSAFPGGGIQIVSRETLLRALPGKRKPELIGTQTHTDVFDRAVLCAGGCAAPQLGTDGGALTLLTALEHILVPPRPALCPLVTASPLPKALHGFRLRGAARLTQDDTPASPSYAGEILFAPDGVSGIAAMQLARFLPDAACAVELDLREGLGFADQSDSEITKALQSHTALVGRLPHEAASALQALSPRVWRVTLPVSGTRGFSQAQVTAGGLPASELITNTLESRRLPGLFVAGEALDVDGDCGGFNLMFAVASGILAGGGGKA